MLLQIQLDTKSYKAFKGVRNHDKMEGGHGVSNAAIQGPLLQTLVIPMVEQYVQYASCVLQTLQAAVKWLEENLEAETGTL